MSVALSFRQWVKARQHPLARALYGFALEVRSASLPVIPGFHAGLYRLAAAVSGGFAHLRRVLWDTPLFLSQVERRPRRLMLYGGRPMLIGPLTIEIGEGSRISGQTTFTGRSRSRNPRLVIGSNCDIGWQTTIAVGTEVRIGNNVRLAGRAFLAGYPGHPLEAGARAAGLPDLDEQCGAIILEDDVWLATQVTVSAGCASGAAPSWQRVRLSRKTCPPSFSPAACPLASSDLSILRSPAMSHDMIVFGEDWGAHPSSTQHIIRQFLPHRKVIWVNSLGLRAPRIGMRDGMRILRKLGDLASRRLVAELFTDEQTRAPDEVIAPAAVPIPGNETAASLTRTFVARQVQAAMNRLSIRQPILWTSLPTAEPLVGSFGERAVVYYAGDDFGALEGVDHRAVLRLEEKLAERAALILAASPAIAARFPAERTMVAPHGVDVALFSTRQPIPADLPAKGPIVGFYGSISGWINVPYLAKAACTFPHAQFVMIGQINTDIAALERFENVHFLGPKKHAELPAYVQNFDVAMLPFRDTPQIRACNPLKLREYLAAGAAVAATDFPALDPYRALIHVGKDADGFMQAIAMALKDKARANLRLRAVQNETWSRRAEDIAAVIDLL